MVTPVVAGRRSSRRETRHAGRYKTFAAHCIFNYTNTREYYFQRRRRRRAQRVLVCARPGRNNVYYRRNIWSSSSLVNTRCGRSGRGVVRYSLSLIRYSSLLRSHRTLNHQSHTNTAWLNCVPFGHRNDACRPSMSQ